MAVATNEQQVLESIPTQLYIGGEWVDGSQGETIAVEDPATEAIASPVEGSSTSSVAPPEASRHSPPMNSWVGTESMADFSAVALMW